MAEYRVTTQRADGSTPAGQTARVEPVASAAPTGAEMISGDGQQPHKAADDTEQVYYEGSPQLRGELGRSLLWIVLGLAIIAAPILLTVFAQMAIPWWGYVAADGVGLVLLAVPWIRMKAISYRISNYRIDLERGLIGRTIDTLELWHIDDVGFRQSIWDRIVGVGNITVRSGDDTTPLLELRSLPHAKSLFDTLKQRVIAVKRQRGVIKMDAS